MSAQGHEEGSDDFLPVTTIQAFPVNTFIENIAVRRTGQLLLTVHNKGELIQLDPNSEAAPSLVHVFPAGVLGIVEVQDDIFYISCGTIGEKGSWAVYKVDMSAFVADEPGKAAQISKHVDVPDALFLNGSALLDYSSGTILLADSILGAIYSVDVHSATIKLWLQHEALGKVTDNPIMPGVNGIKFHNGYLYLSNSDARKFLRASVTSTGDATGVVEVVEENLNVDDFCFDSEGSAYLATHIFQSLVKLRSNGLRTRLAGGPEDTIVAGTTAAAFGRTFQDRTVLYVTTTGGMSNPIAGKVEPGRVLKLDVGHTGAADFRPQTGI
jgi:sugar lactone lactonase YvrE